MSPSRDAAASCTDHDRVYDTRYSTEAEESANADRNRTWPAVNANHPRNVPLFKPHAERFLNYRAPLLGIISRNEVYAGSARPPLDDAPASVGGGGGASSFVLSAIILLNPMETPSMTARRIAHDIAPLRIDL